MDHVPASVAVPADEQDPLALERQVCFALVVAARSVVALYRPLLEPMGLTHPQYLVMLALWQSAPLSVKELSARLQLDPGTLSPLLKRLESQGLLYRARDVTDERLLAVSLSDQGKALRASAELIPGTTWHSTPTARQASSSSPPLPKTKGSPPLRRTTASPSRAKAISIRSISACG